MPFEIEEITKAVKKNPVPWAIGLGAAVIGGYIVFRRSDGSDGYIIEAYPETPVNPEGITAGPGSSGGVSDALLQELFTQLEQARREDLASLAEQQQSFLQGLWTQLEQARHEDLTSLAEQQQSFLQGLASVMDKYVSRTVEQAPVAPVAPVQQPDLELQHKIETIQATPTITFKPEGSSYTREQVDVMYNWAIEENAALSKGYAGTSKNPTGLAAANLVVTYKPDGKVEFTPRETWKESLPSSTRAVIEREEQRLAAASKATTPESKAAALGLTQKDIETQKRMIAQDPSISFGDRDIRKLGLM